MVEPGGGAQAQPHRLVEDGGGEQGNCRPAEQGDEQRRVAGRVSRLPMGPQHDDSGEKDERVHD